MDLGYFGLPFDQGYLVEIVAYRRPSQVLLGSGTTTNLTGVPELLEWWETLAVGAAKKIYEDRQDMDGVAMMDKMLVERYAFCHYLALLVLVC